MVGILRAESNNHGGEAVAVGGHFDHVGLGEFGSRGGSKARGHYRASAYEAAVKRRELEKLNAKYENLEAAQNKGGQNKDGQNKDGKKREIISPTTN